MDISHLSKAKVLAALYNNAKCQGMGILNYDPTPMTEEQAQEILDAGHTYFDYLKGRVMKVSLEGDELDTRLYNRDNGWDSAEKVIRALSEGKPTGTTVSRAEHLKQCKERAIRCAQEGRLEEAVQTMATEMKKHPETADSFAIELMVMMFRAGQLNHPAELIHFIKGFN